jgi:hypothetical protein
VKNILTIKMTIVNQNPESGTNGEFLSSPCCSCFLRNHLQFNEQEKEAGKEDTHPEHYEDEKRVSQNQLTR